MDRVRTSKYYLMERMMEAKAEGFREMQMNIMSEEEYTTKLRYVPEYIAIERQRKQCYVKVLPQAL